MPYAGQRTEKLIQRWTEWLRTQRNYSSHTIQSYLSDLEIFLEYLAKEKVTVSDLKNLIFGPSVIFSAFVPNGG